MSEEMEKTPVVRAENAPVVKESQLRQRRKPLKYRLSPEQRKKPMSTLRKLM